MNKHARHTRIHILAIPTKTKKGPARDARRGQRADVVVQTLLDQELRGVLGWEEGEGGCSGGRRGCCLRLTRKPCRSPCACYLPSIVIAPPSNHLSNTKQTPKQNKTTTKTHHPGWEVRYWDDRSVLALIRRDFPWFLGTYRSYRQAVQRSDAARWLILYEYGGVYIDNGAAGGGWGRGGGGG
jgi:hypothetical protein